ncbi:MULTISPECIES: DUF5412 family protein [Planomicrobium]|uniref:DUF5412 family protein n=1 Tax=Planomicrobium TaxID=162291 RepID=UPI000C7A0C00|nr:MULTISPECIES: DUF5412 family protein [Planomicrobium]PKH12158.1 hypothetical protein CXF70_01245 [Planomicrobium sp. MB-3u-38]
MLRNLKSFVKNHPILSALTIFIALAAGLVGFFINWAFYDMDRIDPGEFLTEEVSPDGKYTLKTYVNNGGATVNYAVLGVLHFNGSKKEPKNIYWQYEIEDSTVHWQDSDTVIINGISIDVPNGKYDYRHP